MPPNAEVERGKAVRRRRSKLWLLVPLALLALAALAYVVAAPYLTLLDLDAAVRARNAAAVAEHVDFARLRDNLKQQVERFVVEKSGEHQNTLMAGLALGVASNLADTLVDSYVTPEGLARLMSGERPDTASGWSAQTGRLFEDASYAYESANRFVVSVPAVAGGDIEFVLTRSGIATWRLSDIEIPLAR
ncbi:MAG TPA: DUF2939 domain-containing protein [Polyangiaceae bacterium]|jgi:hypothetical protein